MCIGLSANAQKLPNVQPAGVYAPANVKVDGKLTEWNNQYQAHNNATEIDYTICNDDKFLYLIIQATHSDICDKILRGGITFIVTNSDNKKDTTSQVSLTYPVYNSQSQSNVSNMFLRVNVDKRESKKADVALDTLSMLNTMFDKESKLILIKGIQDAAGKEISIYNELGIKTAGQFDTKLRYHYELSIPIKYLKLANASQEFSYNIRLNGPTAMKGPRPIRPSTPVTEKIAGPTDFWGKYVLANK
jgi:hypothetical protein